jgi:hypothetical protein
MDAVLMPVSTLIASMAAFGIAAPVASVTVPVRVAKVVLSMRGNGAGEQRARHCQE